MTLTRAVCPSYRNENSPNRMPSGLNSKERISGSSEHRLLFGGLERRREMSYKLEGAEG